MQRSQQLPAKTSGGAQAVGEVAPADTPSTMLAGVQTEGSTTTVHAASSTRITTVGSPAHTSTPISTTTPPNVLPNPSTALNDGAGLSVTMEANEQGEQIVNGKTLAVGTDVILSNSMTSVTLSIFSLPRASYLALGTLRTVSIPTGLPAKGIGNATKTVSPESSSAGRALQRSTELPAVTVADATSMPTKSSQEAPKPEQSSHSAAARADKPWLLAMAVALVLQPIYVLI